jgi:hypothetical protein
VIIARASVLNIKPGYYPKISMILSSVINPGVGSEKPVHIPRTLLMTPEAIKRRADRAERRRKMKGDCR